MCLAIPGRIISIEDENSNLRMGRVSFSGIIKEISLAYVPEAEIDDYVLVHAGFAINKIDEAEANEIFDYLRQISELSEEEK
jgi:hydrogenase expression/formation protein HypC